jgi:DNA-binding response OmpR family regulator
MAYPQTVQRCHEVIAKLEAIVENLQARSDYEATDDADLEAFNYGLSVRQTDLYKMLKAQSIVSRLDLLDEFGSNSYLSVVLVKVRKKLAKHGIKITNCHGVGYRLEGAKIG